MVGVRTGSQHAGQESLSPAFLSYIRSGRKSVGGWYSRLDAEILRCLMESQIEMGVRGAAVEIGVHHGKLLIAACLGLRADEKAYCIDIFENQALNSDQSGHGDRRKLSENLARFGISEEKIVLDPRDSQVVIAQDIIKSVGKARIFSVDGGHWRQIVLNDLKLSEQTISSDGIIMLDDFQRPEWPEVSAGYFDWLSNSKSNIVPFAIGFNKLYMAQSRVASLYRDFLLSDEFMKRFYFKTVSLSDVQVPVFHRSMLPEMAWKTRIGCFFRVFAPEVYALLLKLRKNRHVATENQAI